MLKFKYLLGPLLLCLATSQAAVFEVNIIGDNSDEAIGDGICDVSIFVPGDQCSFRAAIEEANETEDEDEIAFNGIPTMDGRARIALHADLPRITSSTVVDGRQSPGWSLGNPQPVVYLDGENAWEGIRISGDSNNGSVISALAIVRMDNSGIVVFEGASSVLIEGNYVGFWPGEGVSAGNGLSGIAIGGDAAWSRIGDRNNENRLPNIVANNSVHGIFLGQFTNHTSVAGNQVFDNGQCTEPCPISPWKIGGIFDEGTDNLIGIKVIEFGVITSAGNAVYANRHNGIVLDDAVNSRVSSNLVGMDETGGLAPNLRRAIRIRGGSGNQVGSLPTSTWDGGAPEADRRNQIVGNPDFSCIEVDSHLPEVVGNDIGITLDRSGPLGSCSLGIRTDAVNGMQIADNTITGAVGANILLEGSKAEVSRNLLGALHDDDSGEYTSLLDPAAVGLHLVDSPDTLVSENVIASNATAIAVEESAVQTSIIGNYLGVDPSGRQLSTMVVGIEMVATTGLALIGPKPNEQILLATNGKRNHLGPTTIAKILLGVDSEAITARGNSFYGGGMDIEMGAATNDVDDFDIGVNNLQNYPQIDSYQWDYNGGDPTLDLSLFVDSDPVATAYPVQIDVYLSSVLDNDQTRTWAASIMANDQNVPVDIIGVSGVGPGGYIFLQATDADGNSSQLGSRQRYGDAMFADSYESLD